MQNKSNSSNEINDINDSLNISVQAPQIDMDRIDDKIYQIKGLNLRKICDKNKKRHDNKKLNCYYNKLRLNKVNNIIEKFSYNNKD